MDNWSHDMKTAPKTGDLIWIAHESKVSLASWQSPFSYGQDNSAFFVCQSDGNGDSIPHPAAWIHVVPPKAPKGI